MNMKQTSKIRHHQQFSLRPSCPYLKKCLCACVLVIDHGSMRCCIHHPIVLVI